MPVHISSLVNCSKWLFCVDPESWSPSALQHTRGCSLSLGFLSSRILEGNQVSKDSGTPWHLL